MECKKKFPPVKEVSPRLASCSEPPPRCCAAGVVCELDVRHVSMCMFHSSRCEAALLSSRPLDVDTELSSHCVGGIQSYIRCCSFWGTRSSSKTTYRCFNHLYHTVWSLVSDCSLHREQGNWRPPIHISTARFIQCEYASAIIEMDLEVQLLKGNTPPPPPPITQRGKKRPHLLLNIIFQRHETDLGKPNLKADLYLHLK